MAITALVQNVWPPRVLLTVDSLTIGNAVDIYRTVAGADTPVRGGYGTATDTAWITVDAELPFGVPVSYKAIINGTTTVTTSATTYTLPGGKVALSDAITGAAAEVVIGRWPEKAYDRRADLFRVGGRNVVVSGDLGQFTGDIELYVETTSSHDQVMRLFQSATEGVVQMRQPGGYDGVDSYIAILGARVRRFSQDGSDQRRLIVINTAETEPWALVLEARRFTYQDLKNAYAGLTYANLKADYATYLLLAQADLSP